MAKVNAEKSSDYFKGRIEQRFRHWITQSEMNLTETKIQLSKVRIWEFKKKKELTQKLFAHYLQIETIKTAILEVRLLR